MTIEMFMDENCQKTFAEVLIRRRFVKSIDPPPEWNPMAADYQKPGNLLCPILFDSARPRSIYYALFFRLFTKLCYVIREINRSTNRMESKCCRLPKTMQHPFFPLFIIFCELGQQSQKSLFGSHYYKNIRPHLCTLGARNVWGGGFLAVNQGNNQNFVPSLISKNH